MTEFGKVHKPAANDRFVTPSWITKKGDKKDAKDKRK